MLNLEAMSSITPGKTQRTSGTDKVHVSVVVQRDAANMRLTSEAGSTARGGPPRGVAKHDQDLMSVRL